MNSVKIYVLKDPDTHIVKYVGRSVQPDTRYRQHIFSAKKDGPKDSKSSWIRSLLNKNKKPILEIIDECSLSEAIDREIFWINEYRKTGNLKNQRDLVQNTYSFSEESRKKMSNSAKGNTNNLGKKLTKEQAERCGNGRRGKPSPNKGKTASLETKLKLKMAWEKRKEKFENNGLGDSWTSHNKGKTLQLNSNKRTYL